MSYNDDNNNSTWSFWGIIFLVIIAAVILNSCSKSGKSYNSDVYSSWEEEKIDELEADLADQRLLIDQLLQCTLLFYQSIGMTLSH